MADTPLATEALIQRFGGSVSSRFQFYQKKRSFVFIIESEFVNNGKKGSKKTSPYAAYGFSTYDPPNILICSVAEMEATTSSTELQAYKNLGVSSNNYIIEFLIIVFLVSSILS
jgi:hypothetical protein